MAGESISPEELVRRAQNMACDLMGMPMEDKDSELVRLKRQDELMHALVVSELTQVRNKAQPLPKRRQADWITDILRDLRYGTPPKPEDNLGWGI